MYAIRFLPVDPRDPSPALYLSTDLAWFDLVARQYMARPTSVSADLWSGTFAHGEGLCARWTGLLDRCRRDRLRADIVPLDDALRDLEAT